MQGLAAGNPSGIPSARQKREARELAREKLEEEARDGRFIKRKVYPILWDALSNELLVGTTSVTAIDRLHSLFEDTFGHGFEPLGAGQQAFRLSEPRQQTRGVDDATPAPFVPGSSPSEVAWILDENSRDFLGNEYLLWLWYMLDSDSDTIKLADGSEAAVMLARTLVLECPRGQTGRESITSDGPTRLPEARRAIQSGKLPRKIGLTLVRHEAQYELTLQAESLAVSGARLPAPEASEERAASGRTHHAAAAFVGDARFALRRLQRRRAGDSWSKELAKMQKWLARRTRPRVGGGVKACSELASGGR